MNNEMQVTWEEEVAALFNILSRHLPGETNESYKIRCLNNRSSVFEATFEPKTLEFEL